MNTNYKSIKTFPNACKALGLSSKELEAKWAANGDTVDEIAYKKIKIFVKAINGDWTPRMGDSSQAKYWPYFCINSGGSGFSGSGYCCDFCFSNVGSRLCFETKEQALHAIKFGGKMYKDFHL